MDIHAHSGAAIAAVATPHAAGGIAVIRVSGIDAIAIAAVCFRPVGIKTPAEMDGYTCAYGTIVDSSGAEIDDGILTVFRAPHSYTGEDTAEISCHGGIYVTEQVLTALFAAGAAPAEPGEFTKRAFLAGKMSLTQAEAVMDLIGAAGERELSFAHAQQKGALFRRIQQIQQEIVRCLGDLAAWADYPEDDIPAVTPEQLHEALSTIEGQLQETLGTYAYGRVLQSGVSAAIVGKPNVGKSTLFNLLSGCDRSIVTEIAGTTRDIVEEQVRLGNVTLRLSDTAGLHETEDVIEKIGVQLARDRLQKSDLILMVLDATQPLDAEDRDLLRRLPELSVIVVVNKSDQETRLDLDALRGEFQHVVVMAAKDGTGLEALRETIASMFYRADVTPEMGILANARQKQCVESALEQIRLALRALDDGEMLDVVTILLDEAADTLLTLTGERVSEAVVADVFSRFCVGK